MNTQRTRNTDTDTRTKQLHERVIPGWSLHTQTNNYTHSSRAGFYGILHSSASRINCTKAAAAHCAASRVSHSPTKWAHASSRFSGMRSLDGRGTLEAWWTSQWHKTRKWHQVLGKRGSLVSLSYAWRRNIAIQLLSRMIHSWKIA